MDTLKNSLTFTESATVDATGYMTLHIITHSSGSFILIYITDY